MVSTLLFLWVAYVLLWIVEANYILWDYEWYEIAHTAPSNKMPLFVMGMICASQALLQNGREKGAPDAARVSAWGSVTLVCTAFLIGFHSVQWFAEYLIG